MTNSAPKPPSKPHVALSRIALVVALIGVVVAAFGGLVAWAAETQAESFTWLENAYGLAEVEDAPSHLETRGYWTIAVGVAVFLIGALVRAAIAGVLMLVRRSLRQHAVSTLVTVVSVALATGLMMSVFSIRKQTHDAFTSGSSGFDAVLGARGSKLQLVLNSVFHLETSPGNIPWSSYQEIKRDPFVKAAVPYAVGDNYRGYRIVGTTLQFFDMYRFNDGEALRFIDGTPVTNFFATTDEGELARDRMGDVLPRADLREVKGHRVFDPAFGEAVLGSLVAEQTGLGRGDVFNSYHNLDFDPSQKHDDEFKVVGVLAPTGTPIDRVIWIPIDGYFYMQGHAPVDKRTGRLLVRPGEEIPDQYKEVSAVMLKLRRPALGQMLDVRFNQQGTTRTLAWPIGTIMAELFNKIAWANRVLELVAYLVMFVAGGAILASIYNTMNERRREFAILRALGARRRTVFSAIVTESAVIAGLGTAIGYAMYFVLLSVATELIRKKAGVVLDVWRFHEVLVLTPIGMIALGAVTGIVPAFKAYRTDVATNLVPVT